MPPRKPKAHPPAPVGNGVNLRLGLFAVIIVALTVALIAIWNRLPQTQNIPSPAPIGEGVELTTPEGITKASCQAAGGNWNECGSPCHGKSGEVCIQVCEPQCQCGGLAGFSCPKDLVCTDYEPSQDVPDAIGVCRKTVSQPVAEPEPEPEPTMPVREQPTGMLCDERNFICVDETVKDSTLTSPFTVKGSAIAFENTVSWRLLDGNGQKLESGFVTANAPDAGQPGDFEIRAFILNVPKSATGTLEVLEYSAKDGKPTHVVTVPVKLPQQTMSVKPFYPPNRVGADCGEVFPDERVVPRSSLPIETSLRVLLTGHVSNAVPERTQLISLKVSGSTATAVFSLELENYGGGSCNVQAIRAQIEQTLKQFSSIRNVVISVEGKTPEETLQP